VKKIFQKKIWSLQVGAVLIALVLGFMFAWGFDVALASEALPAPETATEVGTVSEQAHEPASEAEEDAGLVGMFGINWKLFLAQLVNFGIIIFVLWKWVFKPVTKGLTDRTEKIESSLAEAERIAQERQTFESWKQGEISTVRAEASGIITAAKQQAESLKAETLKTTASEQARLVEQTKQRLQQEQTAMLQSAQAQLADLVVSASEKILKEKLSSTKDQDLIKQALKEAQQ
jgi:F-type H+-transporting ATPase subunit b